MIRIRPADLSVNDNVLQPGVVLVGDAFSTSCPAAGTGTTKVFNDVQLLCNKFIPRWLATRVLKAVATAERRVGQLEELLAHDRAASAERRNTSPRSPLGKKLANSRQFGTRPIKRANRLNASSIE